MHKKMDELEDRMVEKLELKKEAYAMKLQLTYLNALTVCTLGFSWYTEMLAATYAQQQQEDIQPINRPSVSSNNQGEENNLGGDESMDEDDILDLLECGRNSCIMTRYFVDIMKSYFVIQLNLVPTVV